MMPSPTSGSSQIEAGHICVQKWSHSGLESDFGATQLGENTDISSPSALNLPRVLGPWGPLSCLSHSTAPLCSQLWNECWEFI